jgi:hypothetical protein
VALRDQHRSLEVFRNVKTLDPNAAEMPAQCAHLPPSDGDSTDDYCCQHHDYERHDRESEAQSFMQDDRQITTCDRSVITDSARNLHLIFTRISR